MPIEVTVYGHRMLLDPNDTVITPCLLEGRTFERMTVASLRHMVGPGDTVVDAGANIGYYTLLLARLVGPNGRVLAFEPDARSFAFLKQNVVANGYSNVILSNKALGRSNGQGTLYLNETNRGDNRLTPVREWPSTDVEITSLDAAVDRPVSFIKLDVQGYEQEVLNGASRLLRNPAISIACEVWPEGLELAGNSSSRLSETLAEFDLFLPDEASHVIRKVSFHEIWTRACKDGTANVLASKSKRLAGIALSRFNFFHGLGDCANAAHLFSLYKSIGHDILVECTDDKRVLFQAAGCEVVTSASSGHPWEHAPAPGHPTLLDHYSGNKTAWNISRGGLPDIGGYADRWNDLLAVRLNLDSFVTKALRERVGQFLSTLPRPIILIHTKGNTSPNSKNYPDDLTIDLYRQLLDRMDGTLVLLDWDNRVPRLAHGRVRHIADDWHTPDLVELYELIQGSDLLLGIDSGVLHFARFTTTPTVGIWTRHHPASYSLPRTNTLHVVPRRNDSWNKCRRTAYNLIESSSDMPGPKLIADTAMQALSPRKFVADLGADVLLCDLLARARCTNQDHHPYCDRHKTFGAFLTAMKGTVSPTAVETGCIRAEDDWGAGFSTYLFGLFLKHHGGELHSVDLDPGNVNFARTWTSEMPVTVHHSDSRPWLAGYRGKPISGVYLDSTDTWVPNYQDVCLEEAQLALPNLAANASILIDDTMYQHGVFHGKGGKAVPWLLDQGWIIKISGYQVFLQKG